MKLQSLSPRQSTASPRAHSILPWCFLLSLGVSFAGCGTTESPPAAEEKKPASGEACESDADCDDGIFCNGPELCDAKNDKADANGCTTTAPPCLTGQRCEEDDDVCLTDCEQTLDADGDGSRARECGGDDCDDSRADRFPGNAEVCDSADVDEDCDSSTFGFRDEDGDEYGDARCCNVSKDGRVCGPDCDDSRKSVHPTANETCDDLDNDCNGEVDDIREGGTTFFLDEDGDLRGDPNKPVLACGEKAGVVENDSDCDDTNPLRWTGAPDNTCDGVDNDCDGVADEDVPEKDIPVWYLDQDGDGIGETALPPTKRCVAVLEGYSKSPLNDCAPNNPLIYPGAPDACDGWVNYCPDGEPAIADPDDDMDGDGFAAPDATCVGGPFPKTDCNDEDAKINPAASERCNAIDDNCDGEWGVIEDADRDGQVKVACGGEDCVDNNPDVYLGAPELCDRVKNDCAEYGAGGVDSQEDRDDDGFANPDDVCEAGPLPKSDCDDLKSGINPGQAELCSSVDEDCDGVNNEGCPDFVTLGASRQDANVVGTVSDESVLLSCPEGTVLNEVKTSGPRFADYVEIYCVAIELSLQNNGDYSVSPVRVPGNEKAASYGELLAGQRSSSCGGEQLVSSLSFSGTLSDSKLNCIEYEFAPPYVALSLARSWQAIEEPSDTISVCSADQVAVGLRLTATAEGAVTSLALHCSAPELTFQPQF